MNSLRLDSFLVVLVSYVVDKVADDDVVAAAVLERVVWGWDGGAEGCE